MRGKGRTMAVLTWSCVAEGTAEPPAVGGGGEGSRLVIAEEAAPAEYNTAGGKGNEGLDGTVSLGAMYSLMDFGTVALPQQAPGKPTLAPGTAPNSVADGVRA